MPESSLTHISWALADNSTRKACDTFFRDIFGARTAFELVLTPELEAQGFDREETLLLVGDTMLISIAPVGPGTGSKSLIGNMLRAADRPGMWLGFALSVTDLETAHTWVVERGCHTTVPPGAEGRCFLLDRSDALGIKLEFLTGELPNDLRRAPDWNPTWWRDLHPLGIEGLQSIGVSATNLSEARKIFVDKFGWSEVGNRQLETERADCAIFNIGDALIEAMVPVDNKTPLAKHAREIQGIYCLTFQVRSVEAAVAYLRDKGLTLIGDTSSRFAIEPEQAFGRLIYFSDTQLIPKEINK